MCKALSDESLKMRFLIRRCDTDNSAKRTICGRPGARSSSDQVHNMPLFHAVGLESVRSPGLRRIFQNAAAVDEPLEVCGSPRHLLQALLEL